MAKRPRSTHANRRNSSPTIPPMAASLPISQRFEIGGMRDIDADEESVPLSLLAFDWVFFAIYLDIPAYRHRD